MTVLIVSVLLLAANAFFVALEFSLVAADRARLESLGRDDRRATEVSRQIDDLSGYLAAAQLGITMASIGLGIVTEPAISHALEDVLGAWGVLPRRLVEVVAFAAGLGFLLFAHMVLAEMVPKNVAISRPESVALALSGVAKSFRVVTRPLVATVQVVANQVVRSLGVQPVDTIVRSHSIDDLAVVVREAERAGVLDRFEHDLLRALLTFGRRRVASVMVPRDEVVAVRAWESVEQAERKAHSSGHSRLPVMAASLDDLRGFVHVKDLLAVPSGRRGSPVSTLELHPLLVLEADRTLEDALFAMRASRIHMAVVRREGRTEGVITLEDVLEQLVGDIRDESDRVGGGAS
ncbi:MAG: membrane protein [Acidimicrobiales bacterium]|nr:MAG: membrane protein [Acidimicrobiales bacterium]